MNIGGMWSLVADPETYVLRIFECLWLNHFFGQSYDTCNDQICYFIIIIILFWNK